MKGELTGREKNKRMRAKGEEKYLDEVKEKKA